MLNIFFGDMSDAIYNTAVYFKNTYRDSWITSDLSVKMIKDVDKSEVVSANLIESPILGPIPSVQLSHGVKTLILIANDKTHIFNASPCGNNCAKWIFEIARIEAQHHRKVVINLRHMMDFGDGKFKIKVLNNNRIVTNMIELMEAGYGYV